MGDGYKIILYFEILKFGMIFIKCFVIKFVMALTFQPLHSRYLHDQPRMVHFKLHYSIKKVRYFLYLK